MGRDKVHNLAATCDLDDTATNLDLCLKPGVTVTGSVLDAENRPVSNVLVSLNMALKSVSKELENTRTDAEGSFTFKALPQEGDYSVNVMPSATGQSHVVAQPERTQPNQLAVPAIKL